MKGTFRIEYGFDVAYDEDAPYQAKVMYKERLIDAWATSYYQARADLVKILSSMPEDEEITL